MTLALPQIPAEYLELMTRVARNREAELCRTPSQSEPAALGAYRAALDFKCRAGQKR